ncbi:uncharacterized protein Dvar_00420 [Desulfosarcina variabilis str. Montpellier]
MMKKFSHINKTAGDAVRRYPELFLSFCSHISHLFLWFGLVCAICAGCSNQDGSEAIRALIEKGAAMAEDHDIAGILALTTEDVRAMPMDLDRRGIKGVLWRTFKYYGPMKILYPRPKIELNEVGDQASARVPFLIVKKEQTFPGLYQLRDDPLAWLEAIGDNADLYKLSLTIIKQDGDLRVQRTLIERFTGMGFDTE